MQTRSVPLLDELGGKEWVRSLGVRVDEKASWDPMGTVALTRNAEPKANRVLVMCDRK